MKTGTKTIIVVATALLAYSTTVFACFTTKSCSGGKRCFTLPASVTVGPPTTTGDPDGYNSLPKSGCGVKRVAGIPTMNFCGPPMIGSSC